MCYDVVVIDVCCVDVCDVKCENVCVLMWGGVCDVCVFGCGCGGVWE